MDIDTARNFITNLQTGDVSAAQQRLHDEVIWHQPGQSTLSGEHSGKTAVMKLLADFSANGFGIEHLESYRYNDEVLCRILIRHRIGDRKEFQLISLKEGQISRVRHYGDTDYLSAALQADQKK
jgi:ketosteroid isomerase-like protein